jgi:hypothetical protein
MDYDGFFSDISTVLSPEASKGTPMRRDTSTFVTAGLANEGGTSMKPKVSTGFACRPAKRAIRRFGVSGFLPGAAEAHEFIG